MKHDIESLRTRFYDLLTKLVEEYGFGSALIESDCPDDVDSNWSSDEENRACSDLGIWFSGGCTRLVIGTDSFDYIIKIIPDKSTDENCDYSKTETRIYNDAVKKGLEGWFAWTEKLFDFEIRDYTYPVYVMEWCKCGYDTMSDDSYSFHLNSYCSTNNLDPNSDDSIDKFNECYDDPFYADTEGMIAFARGFNEASVDEFEAFVELLTLYHVNDLHAGNWGYRGSRLVLVDYGGFGDFDTREYVHT